MAGRPLGPRRNERSRPGTHSGLGETTRRSRGTAFCAAVTTADRPRQSRRRRGCVSDGREPGRRGTTLMPLGHTLRPPPGFPPRAKIRYGSFYFQIKTFDRDREVVRGKISARWSVGNSRGGYTQMFDKINSSEIVRSTSSCTIHVFNEEDSNSIIRKTVQRTNILLLLLYLLKKGDA